MEECRPMDTPMVTNLKKVVTSDSKLVDLSVYRQLIGSLMYLGSGISIGLAGCHGGGVHLSHEE
jgi:hypothetical protein